MPFEEIVVRLIAGALLTLANAFFVASEFALTRLRQLSPDTTEGSAALRRAWTMTERLEFYLTGCQLGITTSSILLGVVAEPAVTWMIQPGVELAGLPPGSVHTISVVLAVIVINLVHKIYGEQTPTYWGVERPQMVLRYLAPGLYWWVRVTDPIIRLGDGAAKATLRLFGIEITRSWMEESGEPIETRADLRESLVRLLSRGPVPHEEQEEVLRALDIGKMPVARIMVPRDRMVVLSTGRSTEENLRTIAENPLVRFPLTDDTGDEFLGVVYTPALFGHLDQICAGTLGLAEVAAPPIRVPADRSISRTIDLLQERRQELALVERDGEVVGLVTVTDTFEAIAGQIEDPFD